MRTNHLNHTIRIEQSTTLTPFGSGEKIYCCFCKKGLGQAKIGMFGYYLNEIKHPIVYTEFLNRWHNDPIAWDYSYSYLSGSPPPLSETDSY